MKRLFACVLLMALAAGALSTSAYGEYALTKEAPPKGCEEYLLSSMSPDGETLVFADMDAGEVVLVERATGRSIRVFADYEHSVEDTYGNFDAVVTHMYTAIRQTKSLVWSPDGRYIAHTAWQNVRSISDYRYDIIVIDAHTGGARLYATYSSYRRDDDFGAVYANCFSADSRYLYSLRYTSQALSHAILMRLDIETGECVDLYEMGYKANTNTASCHSVDIVATQAGELVSALDVDRGLLEGLYVAREGVFGWRATGKHIVTASNNANMLKPKRVFASTDSARGVVQYMIGNLGYCTLSVFDSANGFEGFDKPLIFPNLTGGVARRVSADEYVNNIRDQAAERPPATDYSQIPFFNSFDLYGAARIYTCAQSPDGNTAILLASYQESMTSEKTYALLMLDLETLEYEPIAYPEQLDTDAYCMMTDTTKSARFHSGIYWPTDEYVLLNTNEAGCQIFKLAHTK